MMEGESLNVIVVGCQKESKQGSRVDRGFCFELFRRALDLDQPQAWVAIEAQYASLIIFWIRQEISYTLDEESLADLKQTTLTRFWRTLGKTAAAPIATRFEHTGAILRYLNRCTVSSCIEWHRREKKNRRLQQKLQILARGNPQITSFEESSLPPNREERLEAVRQWLKNESLTPEEKMLYEASYVKGLKPAAIAKMYPDIFPSARDVYRVKLRLVRRLQRALVQQH
ncbi:MAG: sigma-70 family RNA polymerase sigma factor [Ardenticatenaceae bacterium]|nr:sigma-70 family RNA polymerase sigma factor [Ardenticatenaceae bacterium]